MDLKKTFVLAPFVCLFAQSALAQDNGCVLDSSNLGKTIRICSAVINSDDKAQLAESYTVRCAAFALQGKPQIGIEDCNKAIALDQNLSSAYRNRGNAHAFLGDYDKAYTDLSKAIELNSKMPKPLAIVRLCC